MKRAEAKMIGQRTYDEGGLCVLGHTPVLRLTRSGECCACRRARKDRWRGANPDKMESYRAASRDRHAGLLEASRGKHDQPERVAAFRRAAALPPDQIEKIHEIYRMARILGYDVDHVVPIRGGTVCGLHNAHNLQLLTPRANRQKGNRVPDGVVLSS